MQRNITVKLVKKDFFSEAEQNVEGILRPIYGKHSLGYLPIIKPVFFTAFGFKFKAIYAF